MQRHVFLNIEQLSQAFADFAATTLQNTLSQKQHATLVVPGGNTPRYYLPALAKCALPWDRIIVTLSDERWVDVNDAQSNEHLVKQHLMNHLPANTRFVGLKTRHDNPFAAIEEIHQRLDQLPLPLSLTVLGLGEDGHIASLFPGMNPDLSTTHHCVAVAPPVAPSPRVSLSLKLLAESENIVLVVTGKTKRRLLNQLNEYPDPELPIVWLLQRTHATITVFETEAQ
ncbi:MAG: 6-phosphogluconolactonase [Nitrosomonas sp.]|uniref:6-phosphogluconolactonase n=1 Tax=Nitrosomonas sp. TaxID=42353 RepID=UPI0027322194|nr:6-phosphogluconolactonase [Nitrosomonas sp.]MDP1550787.1 6-phosphogluconolactonase [Nitrosomonas sp.]